MDPFETASPDANSRASGICCRRCLMRLPFFYGWIIVAVTFVTMAIGVNARTSFSLFFPPIIDEFGWERGVTAGAFSFGFLVSGVVSPLIGRMMDRLGPRAVMELGVALMAGGLLLAPLTTQPWHLYRDDRRHGRRRQHLSRLLRSIAVPAQLVQSPARACDGACLRRRRHRLGDAAALGAAHDRADRLANRLHGDGRSGAGRARADQPVAAQAARGYRARAGRRRGARGIGKPVSNIVDPDWAAIDWTLQRALRTARFWWLAAGYFGGLYIWYAVQVHQTKYLLDIGFSPSVAVWALGAVSLLGIPGQILLGHVSDRVGREWIWTASCLGFAICFAALIALARFPTLPLVYLMVLAQGALGYGLTSIMGAVVLEIFQGKHFGSIFGTVMLAALAGGAAGPWVTGILHDLSGSYTAGLRDRHRRERDVGGRDLVAAPGKIRAVAGQLHRAPGPRQRGSGQNVATCGLPIAAGLWA